MSKALVVLSGGQDSTTCLFWAKRHIEGLTELHAVTFDYGQRHRREIDAAIRVAAMAGVQSHEIVAIPDVLKGTSPLVNKETSPEQYKDWDSLPGGIEKTFVPMRNALFLVLAANRAAVLGCEFIVTGVSQEDYGGYPDCREPFLSAMEMAVNLALGESVLTPPFIKAPLLFLTKAATVQMAESLPGCWEALAFTHTAYDGAYPPTGKDHATLLRAKGFAEAGKPDPLVLRAFEEGLMALPDTPNYANYAKALTDAEYQERLERSQMGQG